MYPSIMRMSALEQSKRAEHENLVRLHGLGYIAMSEDERNKYTHPKLLAAKTAIAAVESSINNPSLVLPMSLSLSPRDIGAEAACLTNAMLRNGVISSYEL